MAIVLRDEVHDLLVVRAVYGLPPEVVGMTFDRLDELSGTAARTGEPIVIADTSADPRYSHFKGHYRRDGAFACVPMKLHGHTTGVFNVLRDEAFSEADLGVLVSLASYTALALAHGDATQRLRALATTDELTGTANRRLLSQRIRDELLRMQRHPKPMALLMLDLDHFKRVNDERGHKKGDQVLFEVAQALLRNVRRIDTVARYGGEEFMILLPDTAPEHARIVADKLRQAVAQLDHGGPRVTISIGLAMYPEQGVTEEELCEAADRALLQAKREGRDRVVEAA